MTGWRAVRLLAVGFLLWLSSAAAAGGRLEEARIQIAVSGDTAWVIAWYRFAGAGDSLSLTTRRPAGQTLIFQGVAGASGFRLDTLPGALRLASGQTDSAPALDVRYHVIGALDSVPLFVPENTTGSGRSEVLVRVSGDARPVPLADPRFRPVPGDGWLAGAARVPAIVALTRRPAGR